MGCFFFNGTATTEIYTLARRDALASGEEGKGKGRGEEEERRKKKEGEERVGRKGWLVGVMDGTIKVK